ncbi:hypothetical protein PUNSTDRAFT_112259 [Punctularia strigosozonata HHB-11173 SS5]|uniref:uncharacterized protein n=1 Tax=Punctularia strigosozonata (strain HHB-11173) TaxID=741275 RepID=UPI00044165CE|nr:uncharacterized protein PUNSTDRAFT_112259 [Punctularia strigosozonata HHB-11173 SS5]EIN10401.1 hypothetical protein PUNSTDRAFT_112259 [Punctularia strigosozonata HHB-11173 SS5]
MPKVVSRSAISTSADAQPTASSIAALRVYYCLCGEFILVIDKHLGNLPRRQTDGATIVRTQDTAEGKARVWKLNAGAKLGEPIFIERGDKHERQWRYCCPRCSLPVCYQCTPPPAKAPYIYIIKGALTQMQGQVPTEAFEGEEAVTAM